MHADDGPGPLLVTTGDGSNTLYSDRHGQTFGSRHGALSEARHVFLGNSGVAARLERGERTRVLEVGFGTGLNFLVTAAVSVRTGAPLGYLALEREPLPAETLGALGYRAFAGALAEELVNWRASLGGQLAGGSFAWSRPPIELQLVTGDALEATIAPETFDSVYHDGFSPDANPELWSEEFLALLAESLKPGGVLVSYTVKGSVRRALAAAGLDVAKVAGPPGGKRESLRAVKR